jgi:hypothetical protein
VKAFTDGETRMIGTVRENNVAASSKKAVEHSKARVSAGPRGSWELIAIPEIESGCAQRKKEHTNLQRTLPKSARTTYPAPKTVFAPMRVSLCSWIRKSSFSIQMTFVRRRPNSPCSQRTQELLNAFTDCFRSSGGPAKKTCTERRSWYPQSLPPTTLE